MRWRSRSSERRISSKLAYFGGGALAGCALAVLLFWAAGAFSKNGLWGGTKALVHMLPPVRMTEGRMDGQVGYAQYPTPIDPESSAWLHFRAEAAHRGNTAFPGSMRDTALADLLEKRIDLAIADLTYTIRENPDNATLLFSDLSALYGERGRRKRNPIDLVAALEAALQATGDPFNPEIRFNGALAEEKLFFYEEAHDLWRAYLDLDNDSPWAEEVRSHIRNISAILGRKPDTDPRQLLSQAIETKNWAAVSRLSTKWPQEAGEILETTLMPKWAEAVARGEYEKADRRLAAAQAISSVLGTSGKDLIFRKITMEMSGLGTLPAKSIAQPLCNFRKALDIVAAGGAADAGQELFAAEQGLRSVRSAAVLLIQFQQAAWLYSRNENSEALDLLGRLGKDSRLADYPSLEARRQVLLGDIARRQAAPTEAIPAYRRAENIFLTLGEIENLASVQERLAGTFDVLGYPDSGWEYRYRALAWASSAPPGKESHTAREVLEGAAFACLEQRRPRVALVFETRLMGLFENLGQPKEIVMVSLSRARIEAALGKHEDAKRDFALAIRALQNVPIGGRQELAFRFDIARREIEQSADRSAVIVSDFNAPGKLGARADFDFRRGDTVAAESALQRSLGELERQRSEVRPGRDRVFLLDQAEPLYHRMVALQLHLARPEKALDTLERFRARYLLDQVREMSDPGGHIGKSGRAGAPLTWREILRRMPEHTAVIVYAEVEGHLANFLVRPSGVLVSSRQPPWGAVSSWAKSLSLGNLRESESARHTLEFLYRDLIAPWKKELKAEDRIIFIPTQSLYGVPFAALRDPATGRFLIQDHEIGVAPSISEFLAAVERDRRILTRPLSSVLLVGNPTITRSDRAKSPLLGPLPGTIKEIEHLGQIYRELDVRALTQAKATPQRVLSLLGSSDVVHFAVHAVEGIRNPARSRLVLSSDRSSPGDLFAGDILRLGLSRTRLVMLAACGTHVGPVSASEGSQSLAYSFLAAGVPAVVGSLWPVDDTSTERFSIRFHRQLQRGADAISALRAAQLEELAAHPIHSDWTWASFQVFGGVVTHSAGPSSRAK